MIINVLKEQKHTGFSEKIKIVQEFKGAFNPFTDIVTDDGEIVSGINTLIEGNLSDIIEWLTQNQPVFVGNSTTPFVEHFKLWMNEEYAAKKMNSETTVRSYFYNRNSIPNSQKKHKQRRINGRIKRENWKGLLSYPC